MELIKSIAVQPLSAGLVAAGVNYMLEGDAQFSSLMTSLKYGAIVGGCQFVGSRATSMLLPEFGEVHLANMQRIALSAGTTASLNILAQRFVSQDFRVEYNALCGVAGGVAAPMVASLL